MLQELQLETWKHVRPTSLQYYGIEIQCPQLNFQMDYSRNHKSGNSDNQNHHRNFSSSTMINTLLLQSTGYNHRETRREQEIPRREEGEGRIKEIKAELIAHKHTNRASNSM